MNGYLRQSTNEQVQTIGPFVSDTDFKTLANSLSILNTDITVTKSGAVSVNKNSGGAIPDGFGGLYHVTWDAVDTMTVGGFYFSIKVDGALVVWGTYTVLEEAVFDMLYAPDAKGYVLWSPPVVPPGEVPPVTPANPCAQNPARTRGPTTEPVPSAPPNGRGVRFRV